MRKRSPVGLIVEGNSTNSTILRLPALAEEIGPIKSTVPRVARRLSNLLRAGYAVTGYDELFEARLILIRAPDAVLPRIIEDLSAAELDFKSLCFVLCESWVHIQSFDALRSKGACVATVMPVPSAQRRWFITEGDARALRLLRLLIERNDGKALALRSGGKELYFAAQLLAAALPIPLFMVAQRALRSAGLSGKELQLLLEEMAGKMFADFTHASRIKWGGPLAECSPALSDFYLDLLRRKHPAICDPLTAALEFARQNVQSLRRD